MLDRQVYFILGVFVTLIIGVPLSFGIIRGLQGHALNTALFFFGALCGALVLLVLVALLRGVILRRLIGTSESGLGEIVETGTKLVKAAATGRADEAVDHTAELTKKYLAWRAWTSFYRWTIATAVTLLVAYAGFAGIVLLVDQNERISEQNQRIEEQNDLQALSIAAEFKKEFSERRATKSLSAVNEPGFFANQFDESRIIYGIMDDCTIVGDIKGDYAISPDKFVMEKVEFLAKQSSMRKRVVDAMRTLLYDSNPTVAVGAALSLDRLDETLEGIELYIRRIHLRGFGFKNNIRLTFEDSVLESFRCDNCYVTLRDSYLSGYAHNITVRNSVYKILPEMASSVPLSSSTMLVSRSTIIATHSSRDELLRNTTVLPSVGLSNNIYIGSELLSLSEDGPAKPSTIAKCEAFKAECDDRRPLKCLGQRGGAF